MARILGVGLPARLLEHLGAGADGLEVAAVDEADVAVSTLGETDHDVVALVLGPGVPDPVAWSQEAYRLDRHVPVLLLPATEPGEAAQQLRISPFVGSETRCLDPAEPLADQAAAILGAAQRELRRRAHRAVVARVRDMSVVLPSSATASQYLGQLLEHAPIGVLITDEHLVVRGWNPRATEIFGRRHDDAVGSRLSALFPESEHQRLSDVVGLVCASEDSATLVLDRARADGTVQHIELTAAAVAAGLPDLGCLLLVQDVTDRVSSHRDLAQRAREANLAADVGLAVTGTDPLRLKLQRCAEAVVEHLDAAFARVWLLGEEERELVLHASAGMYTHLDGAHGRIPVGAFKIGRIAATRQPHLTNDVANDPHVSDTDWARREGMVAFAGYPLVVGEELVGVLALFARHTLSSSTLRGLRSIADAVAVAIDQHRSQQRVVELLELEQAARSEAEAASARHAHLARTLQQSLLPPYLPEIPGLEVAARYHWAGDGSVVGGDFYDVIRMADGSWCAVMGDVTGKGVEAAALTALARYTLRAAALDAMGPAALLDTLNRAMLEFDESDRFCTVAAVAVGGPDRDAMRVALAGHPPPALLRAGGVELVGHFHPPAGLFPDVEYSQLETELPVGASFVLYTDGVTEARSPSGEFRPDLLTEVLARLGAVSASGIVDEIAGAVLAFEANEPRDDLAVLAVRRTA